MNQPHGNYTPCPHCHEWYARDGAHACPGTPPMTDTQRMQARLDALESDNQLLWKALGTVVRTLNVLTREGEVRE